MGAHCSGVRQICLDCGSDLQTYAGEGNFEKRKAQQIQRDPVFRRMRRATLPENGATLDHASQRAHNWFTHLCVDKLVLTTHIPAEL